MSSALVNAQPLWRYASRTSSHVLQHLLNAHNTHTHHLIMRHGYRWWSNTAFAAITLYLQGCKGGGQWNTRRKLTCVFLFRRRNSSHTDLDPAHLWKPRFKMTAHYCFQSINDHSVKNDIKDAIYVCHSNAMHIYNSRSTIVRIHLSANLEHE